MLAQASASGSPYIHLNQFHMHAADLPSNVFAFLLVGTQPGFVPNPAGSMGNLCVGGAIGRFWSALQSSGSTGTVNHQIDLNSIPHPAGTPFPVQAGQTLHFQWWHRDTVNGSPASNFSKGLQATFICAKSLGGRY